MLSANTRATPACHQTAAKQATSRWGHAIKRHAQTSWRLYFVPKAIYYPAEVSNFILSKSEYP